ncbi:TPA: hypothetical protein DF272_03015 [Candidatus Falkowbacteria bacterium]|nr:hypothetical protein [Candidatus Falkowbacteria bacterium]
MPQEKPSMGSLDEAVSKRGLQPGSTWSEVNRHDDTTARAKEAVARELPADSSWDQIFDHDKAQAQLDENQEEDESEAV